MTKLPTTQKNTTKSKERYTMTKLNLLTELLETANTLLENDMTSLTIYQARTQITYLFDKFEEYADLPTCDLFTTVDDITINALSNMPTALAEYFNTLETFISENEIFPAHHSVEQAQLMLGFYTIFKELLQTEVTPCDTHQAYLLLDDLFKHFEQQAEEYEENAVIDYDETPNALNHFFPNIQECLDGLTLFPV